MNYYRSRPILQVSDWRFCKKIEDKRKMTKNKQELQADLEAANKGIAE